MLMRLDTTEEILFIRGLRFILERLVKDETLHYYSDELDALRTSNNSIITISSFDDYLPFSGFRREEQIMCIQFLLLAIGEEI